MEISGRSVVGFLLVFGLADLWHTRLARQKLCKKIHPDHGGRRRPMATMALWSRRWGITKLANILRDKSVPLNLEYIFNINILMAILVQVQRFVNAPTTMVVAVVLRPPCGPIPWGTLHSETILRNKLTSLNLEKNVIYTIMTIINSLTAKSCYGGEKHLNPEGFYSRNSTESTLHHKQNNPQTLPPWWCRLPLIRRGIYGSAWSDACNLFWRGRAGGSWKRYN